MSKAKEEMRAEYHREDFGKGVRGKCKGCEVISHRGSG